MTDDKQTELVAVSQGKLDDGKGGTLELVMWKGEPAVIVDGKHILKRTTLIEHLKQTETGRKHYVTP